jgi:CheY-like chemotaxis protein
MTQSATASLGPRVLVAEDNALIADLIGQVLVELGCAVLGPFNTLDEVLDALKARSFDGALLDLDLGGVSVLPAASVLAARGIPFIIASGHGSPADLPVPLAQAPFLTKPFDFVMLERLVLATFRPSNAAEALA